MEYSNVMVKPGSVEQRIQDAAMRLFAASGATQLTVSDLAEAAGVARGTVYNNVESPEALLGRIAADLGREMHARTQASFGGVDDPALRLSMGIRFFLRRAYEEPHWGRFLCRFALTERSLQVLWSGGAMEDVQSVVARGRAQARPDQLAVAMAVLAGAVLSCCVLVLDGHRTWRDAGSDAAELVLRALGVPEAEALRLATGELPSLSPGEETPA
jgi:AcrR family transcriptional regulator